MDALVNYACRLLGGVFQSQVEPVAAALDRQPDAAALEEGRRNAAQRAAVIRARLAELYSARGAGIRREDILAAYEAAKSLLGDLWAIVMADAKTAAPAAGEWAGGAVARAVARGAPTVR